MHFLRTYELTLKSECGYEGAQPYVPITFIPPYLIDPVLQLLGLGTGCRHTHFVCCLTIYVFVSGLADEGTPFLSESATRQCSTRLQDSAVMVCPEPTLFPRT